MPALRRHDHGEQHACACLPLNSCIPLLQRTAGGRDIMKTREGKKQHANIERTISSTGAACDETCCQIGIETCLWKVKACMIGLQRRWTAEVMGGKSAHLDSARTRARFGSINGRLSKQGCVLRSIAQFGQVLSTACLFRFEVIRRSVLVAAKVVWKLVWECGERDGPAAMLPPFQPLCSQRRPLVRVVAVGRHFLGAQPANCRKASC